MALINKLHHVALRYAEPDQYDRAVSFYTDVIGLRLIRRWRSGGRPACMIDAGNAVIEILPDGGSDRTAGPVDHFAFETDDPDECAKVLRDAGYEITRGPQDAELDAEQGHVPLRVVFCRGPVGEIVEFYHEKESGR